LEKYLPEQMDAESVMAKVSEIAAELGISGGKENMGKLMGAVMGKLKGMADGNQVREAVTKFLS